MLPVERLLTRVENWIAEGHPASRTRRARLPARRRAGRIVSKSNLEAARSRGRTSRERDRARPGLSPRAACRGVYARTRPFLDPYLRDASARASRASDDYAGGDRRRDPSRSATDHRLLRRPGWFHATRRARPGGGAWRCGNPLRRGDAGLPGHWTAAGGGLGTGRPGGRGGAPARSCPSSARGDWYGRTVNIASRVTGKAPPGQIVCTPEVRNDAEERIEFAPLGETALKGIEGRISRYQLVRR